jgi:gliding motility-associated-like protein
MRCIRYSLQIAQMTGLFILLAATSSRSQSLQVTNAGTAPFTPSNLISNVFLGAGVEVSSITFNGQPISVGYFTNGSTAVGLERGIVMTTGLVETANANLNQFGCHESGSAFANNNVGGFLPGFDSDLGPIAGGALFDIATYTITFVPTSDTLRFRYCFASEEYPEFACSQYNDIFGFFIQGPNYPSPTNIARIPGTGLPVSINNIHPDNTTPSVPCPPVNAQYYINNLNSNAQPTFDGLTRVFTAEAIVVPCQTYTIKLVIADVGDPAYDSGVFLEAKSFGTGALRTTLATPSLDGTVTEGCSDGSITFRLPLPADADFPIDYQILGTATNGVDYQTIPSNLFIPAGQQEIVIPIVAVEDALAEGTEFIALDVRRDPCNRDTILVFLRENTIVPPDQLADAALCLGNPPVQLNGALPIPLPTPPSFSISPNLSVNPVNTPVSSAINVFGVLPAVLQPGMIRSVCLNATHGWVDDWDVYLISPGGQVLELMTDCGGTGKNFTNICFTPTAPRSIATATAFDAPFTGNWLPEGPWSDLWGGGAYPVNGAWRLSLRDDQNGFVGTLHDWSITFEPLYGVDYTWTPTNGLSCPDCPRPDANPTTTTTYFLHAVDSYGCDVSDTVSVSVVQALDDPTVVCGGFTNNSITFNWNDVPGAAGYLVNVGSMGWMPPSGMNIHTVTGLAPGATITIEVQAVDSSGTPCPALIGTATCSNCDPPVVNVAVTNVTCPGGSNGGVVLTPDGINPPYTFALAAQNNATGVFTNLSAGAYTATVTDATGCSALVPVTIGSPNPLVITITPENVTCFNGDNGAGTAVVTGGTGPYNYKWSDAAGQTSVKAVNLKVGTYTVTVTDSHGCTGTASVTLTSPPDLIVFVTPTAAKCNGQASGMATVSASGGVGPYNFAWSYNGQTGPIAVNLPAGSHLVTVTDAVGCAKTSFALIFQPPALTANTTATNVTCANLTNGAATTTASGGTGTKTFVWSTTPPQTTATASNLGAGVYTVTITDANGCTLTQTATVTAPPAIAVSAVRTNVTCFGTATGTATATASGGSGTLAYQWSDPAGQTTPAAANLTAGAYTVTVTDGNGCTNTASVTISQPQALVLNLTTQAVACFGQNTGSVSSTVVGGTTPYSYSWSSSELSPGISAKAAGTYTLTLTDNNGCSTTASATVTQPTALTVSASQQNISCFGATTGSAQLTPGGGTTPYSVTWSGPGGFTATGTSLSNLAAGNYSATVSDAAGCTATQALQLTQPVSALAITLPSVGDTICFGAANGLATASASGGTSPFQFLWAPGGQTTPAISNLSAGTYTLTVTDANNCNRSASITIPQKQLLSVQASGGSVDCAGSSNGQASVTSVLYGNTPAGLGQFTYLWSTNPAQTSIQAVNLLAGQTYTVTVTDAIGCSATQTVSIADVPALGVGIVSSANPTCFDGANGRAIVAGSGGLLPYSYNWGAGVSAVDSLAQNLRAGTYFVTVTDAKGCTGTASVTLSQPTQLKLRFQPTAVVCYGESTGKASVSGEGGTPPYQFAWPSGSTATQETGLAAGFYAVTLTDRNGCTHTDSVEIKQPDVPLGGTLVVQDVGCSGGYSGSIQVVPSGGTPPYRYALDGGPWNGSSIQIGLTAGQYVPSIQDNNGCTATLNTAVVAERPEVGLELGPTITIQFGESTQLQAVVTNAADPVQYIWNPADSLWLSCLDCPDPFVDGLEDGRWLELKIVDSFGCTATDRVLVVVEKVRRVHVPTGFSPNGDFSNDLLLVHGQQGVRVVSFRVYDRWGEQVYEGLDFPVNDPNTGWDGTFRGEPMNPGVFVWVLEVEFADGNREVYKGNTTLIR